MIDERRKEKRHQDNIQLTSDHWEKIKDQADVNNPEQFVLHKVRKEQIQQAFNWLSENQVQLLVLLYWEGYSLRDIAELKNEPLGTIKSRLHQALKILRHHMVIEREG
jgi:RNA polymerase sigma-70 factor (ECF subfamily)